MSRFELFLLAVALVNVVVVVEFVRRRKLLENYAILWIGVGLGGIFFALGRSLLDRVSQAVGISYGANLILALGVLFLLFVCMSLSLHVSRLESRTEILAEEIAMLRGVHLPARGVDEGGETVPDPIADERPGSRRSPQDTPSP